MHTARVIHRSGIQPEIDKSKCALAITRSIGDEKTIHMYNAGNGSG